MKKIKIALLTLLLTAALLSSCCPIGVRISMVTGSGKLLTREMDLSDFAGVDAGSTFEVDITQAETFSVTITADDNLYNYLDVAISGDTLHLRLKPDHSYGNVTLRAKIAMPDLRVLRVSGASRATVAGFESGKDLEVEASGASTLQGDIKAGNTRIEVSGASSLTLTGSGGNLSLTASGGSRADLRNYPVRDADIELSGASRVTLSGSGEKLALDGSGGSQADLLAYHVQNADVNLSGASRATLDASGRLDAELSGASQVEYTGNPSLGRISTSGASSIAPR